MLYSPGWIKITKIIQFSLLFNIFSTEMATLRNKKKLRADTRETQEYQPGNGRSRNVSVRRVNENYITQVSDENEGKDSQNLSQEFSRTESPILGALSKLDEFLLSPQVKTQSGTVPGTSRNTDMENQEPNGDRSQNDLHPEVGSSAYRSHHSVEIDPGEPSSSYSDFSEALTGNVLSSEGFPLQAWTTDCREESRRILSFLPEKKPQSNIVVFSKLLDYAPYTVCMRYLQVICKNRYMYPGLCNKYLEQKTRIACSCMEVYLDKTSFSQVILKAEIM